jgi:hypothetical protein
MFGNRVVETRLHPDEVGEDRVEANRIFQCIICHVRAYDAEVDVVLDITAKVPHVFQSFAGILDEADEALDRAALFLRQRVRG